LSECHSPGAMSWGDTSEDSEDDDKLPAKKINNPENVKAGSSKCKIDQVLQGTGTLFMDGTGKDDDDNVKQPTKVNKQLGHSFESASGISEMTSGSGPTLPIQPFPPVVAMNQVAVTAAASSKRKIEAASTRRKPDTSKNAVAWDKNENKIALASNLNTWQTMLTQLQYPSPPERVLQISTLQHLFEANRYPERTIEEFYASKKSHRGAVVQYAGQLEALMALLQDIWNNSKLQVQPNQTLWLGELKKGKPPAVKLAFRILCFASLMGKISDAMLRAYLVPVLIWKDFSVNWLADITVEFIQSQLNVLEKTGFCKKS